MKWWCREIVWRDLFVYWRCFSGFTRSVYTPQDIKGSIIKLRLRKDRRFFTDWLVITK